MTQKEYEIICRFIDLHLSKNDKTEDLKEDIKLLVEKNDEYNTLTIPKITTQPNYMYLNDKSKYSGTPIFDSSYIDKFTCTTNPKDDKPYKPFKSTNVNFTSTSQDKNIKVTC